MGVARTYARYAAGMASYARIVAAAAGNRARLPRRAYRMGEFFLSVGRFSVGGECATLPCGLPLSEDVIWAAIAL